MHEKSSNGEGKNTWTDLFTAKSQRLQDTKSRCSNILLVKGLNQVRHGFNTKCVRVSGTVRTTSEENCEQ